MFTVIVVLVLCAPLILGPLIIPARKRAKTEEALERLLGKDERLPKRLSIGPAAGRSYGWKRSVFCETQLDANSTKVDCGGRLHHLIETLPGGSGSARLATVCFLCGRLEKTGRASRVLGSAFDFATDAAGLESVIHAAKGQERRKRVTSEIQVVASPDKLDAQKEGSVRIVPLRSHEKF